MTNKEPMTNDQLESPRLGIVNWSLVLSGIGHWGLLIVAFAAMASLTWFGWCDPIIDFGREMYLPWQVMQGKVLYRDIAHFNGPLSVYFNAMVFAIFGMKIGALAAINLLLLAILIGMIWRIWFVIGDALSATAACLVLICVFAFIQLVGTGNYNFVTPYSHELTHGVILSVAAILFLSIYLQRNENRYLILCGFALGLVALTKPEVFLAAVLGVGAGAMLSTLAMTGPLVKRVVPMGAFVLAGFAPLVVAFLLLWLSMPAGQALRGILGGWIYLFDPRLREIPLYQTTLGTFDLADSFFNILASCAVYAALLAILWLAGTLIRQNRVRNRYTWAIMLIISAILGVILFNSIDMNIWQQSIRGWTIVMPVMTICCIFVTLKAPRPRNILRTTIAIFGTALLAKVFFNVRTYHYGFALAMPATLLIISAALHWMPTHLSRRGGYGAGARAIFGVIIAIFVAAHLTIYFGKYRDKQTRVSGWAGHFYADPQTSTDHRGAAVNALLAVLNRQRPEAKLACIPEGAMINCLANRNNPTPYVSFLPPEMIMFGSARMFDALKAHPPDFILRTTTDSQDYGQDSVQAFAPELIKWMDENYAPAPDAPGMPLLMRRPIAATQPGNGG